MRLLQQYGVVLLIIASCTIPGSSQSISQPGRYVTFSEYLESKGIRTRAGTIVALSSNDPEIRGVAAFKLAEDHDSEAVQLITNALGGENDPSVQVNLASALLSLDIPAGGTRLSTLCESTTSSTSVVIKAAQQLAYRQLGGSCAYNLIQAFNGARNKSDRVSLLSLLAQIAPNAPANLETSLLKIADEALQDPSPSIRLQSSELLVRVNTVRSLEMLSTASQNEQEPLVKRRFAEALLRAKQTSGGHNLKQSLHSDQILPNAAAATGQSPCLSQICPTSASVTNKTVDPLPPLVPQFLTGFGIVAQMSVGPSSTDYYRVVLTETLSTVATSCPAQYATNGNYCPGGGNFVVGTGLRDNVLMKDLPPITDSFYDFHESANAANASTVFNNGQSCSIDCTQQYICNGTPLGNFTITRDFIPDVVTGSDGKTYAVTTVVANKL